MATPLFSNDPAFIAYMEYQFRKLHEYNIAHPDPRYSVTQARQEAFRRARAMRFAGRI
jgi:hypothetical protein